MIVQYAHEYGISLNGNFVGVAFYSKNSVFFLESKVKLLQKKEYFIKNILAIFSNINEL